MSKKGITPVIAMILLILIVVALGGVFAAWTTRTWQGVQEKGGEQVEQISGQMTKSVTIDNINCDDGLVYMKNTGSANVTSDDVGIYINDTLITDSDLDYSPTNIGSDKLMTINYTTGSINGRVKISVGAGIQDSNNKCV